MFVCHIPYILIISWNTPECPVPVYIIFDIKDFCSLCSYQYNYEKFTI